MKLLYSIVFAFVPLALMGQEDGLRDIEEVIYLPYWTTPKIIALCIALLIALGLIFFLVYKFTRKPAPRLTPYERAVKQLHTQKDHIAEGEDKVFCSEVSNVVRFYLEEELAVPAPERTTEEFLQEVAQHRLIKGEVHKALGGFLSQCDLVKFANEKFNPETRGELLTAATSLIKETHQAKEAEELAKKQQEVAKP